MLPDELIHYILSFVDAKYAVQSCILSKRWIHIWKSLPFLNFNISAYADDESYREYYFVDTVFRLRDDVSYIQKVTVSWSSNFKWIKELSRWIDAAVEHHLEEVNIDVSRYESFTYEISPGLFNCKSLKKLTLRADCYGSSGYAEVVLPKTMSLPQLKFMRLKVFRVSSVNLTKSLFLSCPLLETLNIDGCDIQTDNQRNLLVESLYLKQFAYTQLYYGWGNPIHPTFIKLSAPNLNSFIFKADSIHDFNLQNCSDQLSEVILHISYKPLQLEKKEDYARRMVKHLVSVDKAKRLDLSPQFLQVLSGATNLVNCKLPCLCNLQSLRFEMWWTRASLRGIAYLLTTCPNIITSMSNLDVSEERFLLPGMVSHLSAYRIENAEGCNAELKFLDFLLKNAKCLEEVALYPCPTVESLPGLRDIYKDKLRAYSRITMRWGLKRIICR